LDAKARKSDVWTPPGLQWLWHNAGVTGSRAVAAVKKISLSRRNEPSLYMGVLVIYARFCAIWVFLLARGVLELKIRCLPGRPRYDRSLLGPAPSGPHDPNFCSRSCAPVLRYLLAHLFFARVEVGLASIHGCAKSVFEKFQATLQGINVAFVKLEIARQSICHRRERRSMGTARPTFAGSATRRSAAHNRYSCCDQRDFLSAAHRLPVASSSAGVSSLGHRVSLFPDVEELRCVDVSATSNL
jgi:hypothetical protein